MTKVLELVFCPCPIRGHFAPVLEFAKLAVARDDNLSITVLLMKSSMDPNFDAYADSLVACFAHKSERLKFVDISQGIDTAAAGEGGFLLCMDRFVESHKLRAKRAVNDNTARPRLAGFVIDVACMPMADVADELGLPTYVFWGSSAGCLGLNFHLQGGSQADQSCGPKPNALLFPCFTNPVPEAVLPSIFSNPVFVRNIRRMRETKGVILNTSAELEPHAVRALVSATGSPPVYSVGPILSLTGSANADADAASVLEWLDRQPPSSVIFLCFGSMGSFGRAQVREIAAALEKNGFRFLWTLQARSRGDVCLDPASILPEGFLDRTVDVGRVVGWAPQAVVLSHRAVGGFVSHCGWNSLLESVWLGVPVAAWPLYAEQQLNAFGMVTELGLAVEIKMDCRSDGDGDGDEAPLVSADEIGVAMRKLVMEGESGELRKRVREMSDKCRMSVVEGGSSSSSLACFLSDVSTNLRLS